MTGFARPCLVCGRRVEGGEPRCPDHAGQRYSAPVGCYVCGRRGPRGYCELHDPYANHDEDTRLQRQPWRHGYRLASYRAMKKAVLARAGGRCEKCGRADLPLEVDHVVPLSTASTPDDLDRLNTPENGVVLCVTCHRVKTRSRR